MCVWREIVQTDTHHIVQVADWHQWNKQIEWSWEVSANKYNSQHILFIPFFFTVPHLHFLMTDQASTTMKLLIHNFKNICTSFTQQHITYSILCPRAIIHIAHFLLCFIFQNISLCNNSTGYSQTSFVD